MIKDAGTPTRRAALLMYAMAPGDRDWMLEQLPAHEAQELRRLLEELASLGIPRDRSLLQEVIGEPPLAPAASPLETIEARQAQPDAMAAAIAAAGAARCAAVLRGEPAQLVVLFLQAHDWPWRDAFIAQLGAARSRDVADLLAASARRARRAPGAAARQVLLGAVYRKLRLLPAESALQLAPAVRPTVRTRAGRWLGSLGAHSGKGAMR